MRTVLTMVVAVPHAAGTLSAGVSLPHTADQPPGQA